MEEEVIEKPGTSFWTLFKAVCKKWLIIGFCVVFGALIGCIFALAMMPLTKNVYQRSVYLYRAELLTDAGPAYNIAVSNDQNIANIREYFRSEDYRQGVYNAVKEQFAPEITDAAQKEIKFKNAVKISVGQAITIYVIDQDEAMSKTILDKFAEAAVSYVTATMDEMKLTLSGVPDNEIATVVAKATPEAIRVDAKNVGEVKTVTTKDRIMKVVMGAVIGLVGGAAVALCLYYFNNKVNSANMLNVMGITAVYAGKKGKGGAGGESAAAAENALRYNFVIEKQGCKAIAFVSPEKTVETRKAIEAQAEILRGRGYKTLLLEQAGQKPDEWRKLIDENAAGNDFILIDAAAGTGFDCAAPAAAADGATVIVDQKRTKLKDMKHAKEILDTAKITVLSALVINAKEDFVL